MAKLLMVGDDGLTRNILVRRLESRGFILVSCAEGREALPMARLHRPDLILLDLDMPGPHGRNAMNTLRNDPRTFRTPIIVLTTRASPEDVAAAAEAGCHSFETKPVVLARLVARIEDALGVPTSSSRGSLPSAAS
jgi:CheY-like chemotaxis protein